MCQPPLIVWAITIFLNRPIAMIIRPKGMLRQMSLPNSGPRS
jgi:hypothetical protein